MKPDKIIDSLGKIDAKYVKDIFEEKKTGGRKRYKNTLIAAVFVAVIAALTAALVVFGMDRGGDTPHDPGVTSGDTTQTDDNVPRDTARTDDTGDVWQRGGETSIPELPGDRTIYVTGEELTDSEAHAFFEEHFDEIAAVLKDEDGIPSDGLRFAEKGFCHVSYGNEIENRLELRQDIRDYFAYSGDRLVAVIRLFKDRIDGSIAWNYWSSGNMESFLNAKLQQYKGQEIVFIFAGRYLELFIVPDGHYYERVNRELDGDFGDADVYSIFYHEKAVYVP